MHECYTYGDSRFDVTNDLGLHHFSIYSKDFPILTKKVDAGGIRVSQKASVLEKYHLEGEKAIDFSNEYSRKIGGEWYYYDNPSSPTTDVFMVLIKDGIIYGFMYSTII